MAKGKRHTATAFVTGGSGGVGKSFTARALAQALGSHGYVTLLVDGNPGQQSQRAFLGVDWSRGIEDVGISGAMASVLRPREVKAAFGFLPGPMAPQDPDLLDRYGDALVRLEDPATSSSSTPTVWTAPSGTISTRSPEGSSGHWSRRRAPGSCSASGSRAASWTTAWPH